RGLGPRSVGPRYRHRSAIIAGLSFRARAPAGAIAASPASTRVRTASAAVVNSAALRTWTSLAPTRPRDRPGRRERSRPGLRRRARLRAMAARERHVGRIVGRAGADLQLGDCRATGRGHLAYKGRTDALHVCSGCAAYWLPAGHDNSDEKKVNIHKRFWLS